MREMTANESMNVNGGTTYICPFGCNKTGSYSSVYTHCLTTGCFKKNAWLNALWQAAKWCLGTAAGNIFTKALTGFFYPVGKRFK